MSRWLSLLVFITLVAAAAVSGGQFRPGAWYAALAKPAWTPPGWLFGPVWAVLYLMIAVAGWLVWRAEGLRAALMVWGLQLALNGAWSWLMFGRQAIGLALIDILAMLAAIIAFIVLARPVSRPAALLFVPYLAWVSFATALNATIWRMNG
jgi:tryptophan-rich sensory protein